MSDIALWAVGTFAILALILMMTAFWCEENDDMEHELQVKIRRHDV